MRLRGVEQGDGFANRLLIGFISMVSGMRLPDAARIVMYHKDFYGDPMTAWTQATMRGKSNWSVGERELMAAMTAKWNSSAFCIDAHKGIASLALEKPLVEATLHNLREANLPVKLTAILGFLEVIVLWPDKLTAADVQSLFQNGIKPEEIEDALAVATLFSITVRCADTFNFAMLNEKDSEKASKRMLAQGYSFTKPKNPGRLDHHTFANTLRQHIFESPGMADTLLRQKMGKRATGGPPIEQPYDDLALQIGEAAYMVTDEQVTKVLKEAGSEKAAFELIVAAAVSAGLYRWQIGLKILNEALRS